MTDIRVVSEVCVGCDGEGRFNVLTGYDPRDDSPMGYTLGCDACGGAGGFETQVEFEPVTADDLDEVAGGDPADHWPGCLPGQTLILPMECSTCAC